MKDIHPRAHSLLVGTVVCWVAVACSQESSNGSTTGIGGGGATGGGTGSGFGTSIIGGAVATSVGGISAISGISGSGNLGGNSSVGSSGVGGGIITTISAAAGVAKAGTSKVGLTEGAGGKSSNSTESPPTAVTGLKIEANPKNVLSAFVSWTTDKATDSVVQFGQGKYEWEIANSAMVTSHKVLVIGMYASKAYQIKAISKNGGGSVSATGTFTTGSLPSTIPVGTVPIKDKTKSQAGWTSMNIQKGDGNSTPTSTVPAQAVMYDATGQPVWYYINGTTPDYGGASSVDSTDKGVIIGPILNSSGKRRNHRVKSIGLGIRFGNVTIQTAVTRTDT